MLNFLGSENGCLELPRERRADFLSIYNATGQRYIVPSSNQRISFATWKVVCSKKNDGRPKTYDQTDIATQ
jgi:hypothetical protein